MKHFLIGLCFLGLTSSVFAQDGVIFKGTLTKEQVPTVVLEAIEVDFPGYVLREFAASPLEYVEKDVYVGNDVVDSVDTYQVSLEGKGKFIIATYNNEGKLLAIAENLKNVTPPLAVSRALIKAYPGWTISKDSYHMSSKGNGKEKERYRFVLTKDGMKQHVDTDTNGTILKASHKRKE